MIGIAISFDLGRYHATPWGEHVNEGLVEWPPSPWRIVRSLFAVSRTNVGLEDARAATDRALGRLLGSEPPAYTLPPSTEAHTRHYVPSRSWSAANVRASDLVIDAFRSLPPGDELVVWWPVDLPPDERSALERVVCAMGHLGRSEAVCSARLVDVGDRQTVEARPADERTAGETVDLLCPAAEATLDDVARSVTELRRQRLRLPLRARFVPYELALPPGPATSRGAPRLPPPDVALLRLGGPNRPGLAEAVAVAQALRSAAQSRFGAVADGAASPTFSGRRGDRPRGDQHRHAHYLVLPDREGRRAERLVIWAPEGFGQAELQALGSLRKLVVRGAGDPLPIALAATGSRETLALPQLLGPARRWRSLTPFGLVRHPKTRGGRLRDGPEEQVRIELERRGFPPPTEVELLRGSWHRFRSSRVGATRLQRARVFGVRLVFAEPVRGPIALGALCHFGLGVFIPDGEPGRRGG